MCLGIVMTVGAVYCADLTGVARITTDAEQYIGTARNLLAGRGIMSDVALSDLHHRFGRLPFPLTEFPPGYPLLIAIFLAFGASGTVAVARINFLSLFTSALLIYAILRTLEVRRSLRLAGMAFWLGFVPSWAEAFTGGSTLPFILATLLSHLSLLLWRSSPSPYGSAWLFVAGVAAATGFTIRYVGVFFIISTFLYAAYASRFTPWRPRVCELFGTALVPVATVGLVLGRNYELVGSLFSRPQGSAPWEGGLPGLLSWSLCELSGVCWMDLWRGELVAWISLVGIVVITGLVAFSFAFRMSLQDLDRALPALLYVALMVVCLGAISVGRGRPYLESRYLLPVVPFVLIVVLHLLNLSVRLLALELSVFMALAASFSGQAQVFARILHETEVVEFNRILIRDLGAPVGNTTLRGVLEASITEEHPLFAEPHQEAIWLELPVVGMSPPEYSQVAWTEEEVRRLIEQFKIRLVLVLREAQRFPPLPFASELKAGRIPSWLRCVYCDAHILLLRVVDASLPSRSVDESLSGTPAR